MSAGTIFAFNLGINSPDGRPRRPPRAAIAQGVVAVSSAAVLLKAKEMGLISAVRPILDDWRAAGCFLGDASLLGVMERRGKVRTSPSESSTVQIPQENHLINVPQRLFRYRPLNDSLFDREIEALRKSYLYAPSFEQLNDPMEAFYQVSIEERSALESLFRTAVENLSEVYETLTSTVRNFGVISFSASHTELPLWAYYGSNFGGFCLEFENPELSIGDLKNEPCNQVTYAPEALPQIRLIELFGESDAMELIRARITRKRIEWAHEKEWRIITGCVGPKHYADYALRRIYLGPRILKEHEKAIRTTLARRPVEILKGTISGFELRFTTLQSPCALDDCERIGAGRFDPKEDLYAERDLRNFLSVPFEKLIDKCNQIRRIPSMNHFAGIDISTAHKNVLYIQTVHKLRSGREAYYKQYFDRSLQTISELTQN